MPRPGRRPSRPSPPFRRRVGLGRGLVLAVTLGVLAGAACARPTPEPPPPYRTDGAWSWLPVGTALPEPVSEVEAIRRVRLGNGVWEAFGWVQDTAGRQVLPALWVSPDGARWQPVGVPVPPGRSGRVTGIADDGRSGLLVGVVGSGPAAEATVWHSTDGWRWEEPTTLPRPDGSTGLAVHDVAHVGSAGWVAVGGPAPGGSGPAVVWTSPDGRSWSVQAVADGDGVAVLQAVASREGVVVALGLDAAGAVVAVRPTGALGSSPWRGTRIGAPAGRSGVPSLPLAVDGGRFVTAVVPTTPTTPTPTSTPTPNPPPSNPPQPTPVPTPVPESVPDSTPVLAWSVDGAAWEPGPALPAAGSVELAAAADRVRIAVDPASGPLVLAELDAGVWRSVTGPPLDDAGPGPVVTGLSPGGLVVVAPEPLGEPARSTWRRVREEWVPGDASVVPAPQRRQADEVLGVAGRPGALVAVGRATRRPAGAVDEPAATFESVEARVWSSTDGVTWQEVPVTSAGEVVRAVAAADDGTLLAVGSLRTEEGGGPLWLRSRDGRMFERMAVPTTDPASVARVPAAVVRAGDRWVAAGQDRSVAPAAPAAAGGPAGATAAVWWSPDGAAWTPATVPTVVGRITALCGSGPDLLAVGEGDDGSALVWRSSDGATWQADPIAAGLAATTLTGCEVLGADATVVGERGGRLVAVSRVDGSWRAPEEGPAVGATGAVARVPGGWVATGSEPGGSAVVWRSADRRTWEPDPDVAALVGAPRSGLASSAAVGGDRLLVGGVIGEGAAVLVRSAPR